MKLSELFKGRAASSAELRAARDQLSVAVFEKRISELTQARREALLADDDKELRRIESEIEQANLDAERTTLQIEALTLKIAEAEAREKESEVERRRAEASAIGPKMHANYVLIDEAAQRLSELLEAHLALKSQLRDHSNAVRELTGEGLGLGVIDPWILLMRSKLPAPQCNGDYPESVHFFRLPGYFPRDACGRRLLSKMKEFRP